MATKKNGRRILKARRRIVKISLRPSEYRLLLKAAKLIEETPEHTASTIVATSLFVLKREGDL